jgi:ferric-dicitrate binding protein FerR (iron transport regulator)
LSTVTTTQGRIDAIGTDIKVEREATRVRQQTVQIRVPLNKNIKQKIKHTKKKDIMKIKIFNV